MAVALRDRLRRAEALLESRKPSDRTGEALGQVLAESCDIARGAIQVLEASLPSSAIVLGRALFERMMLSKWIVTKEPYAEEYLDLGKTEVLRQMRKLLTKRYGFMRDKNTGEDQTQTVLEDPRLKPSSRRRIEDIAKEAELEDIYHIFYGFLSMPAHGSTAGLPIAAADLLSLARDVATKSLQVVAGITAQWDSLRRGPTGDEVRRILLA